MPKSYVPVSNKVCDKSIGFHFANGKIHDTNGAIDKKGTNWRVVREQAKKGMLGKITIEIDADAQTMKWKLNGEPFAESVITNYLKQKSFTAFASMFHKDDIVKINMVPAEEGKVEIQKEEEKKSETIIAKVEEKSVLELVKPAEVPA
jgi:hypothetical protein